MDEIIRISVMDKIARTVGSPVIVCDNSSYVVEFDFDNEWDAIGGKVCRFAFDEKYIDVAFTGDRVAVPRFDDVRSVSIGVYGENITTTAVKVRCLSSALSNGVEETEPLPGIYEQFLGAMDAIHADIEAGKLKGDKGDPGRDGITPVFGVDYFTEEQTKPMRDAVDAANAAVRDAQDAVNTANNAVKAAQESSAKCETVHKQTETALKNVEAAIRETSATIARVDSAIANVNSVVNTANDAANNAKTAANLATSGASMARTQAQVAVNSAAAADRAAEKANGIYEVVRSAYESGAFKGESGERGEQGEPGPAYDDTQLRADLAKQIADAIGGVAEDMEGLLNGSY